MSFHTHLHMRLIHFPHEIFLIWTSFCPTFSDETLNGVANSSCMAEIFNSNLFYSFTPKASDMDEYHKHWVDSMKEAADTSIPKVDCLEKADEVKITKDTLKLINPIQAGGHNAPLCPPPPTGFSLLCQNSFW